MQTNWHEKVAQDVVNTIEIPANVPRRSKSRKTRCTAIAGSRCTILAGTGDNHRVGRVYIHRKGRRGSSIIRCCDVNVVNGNALLTGIARPQRRQDRRKAASARGNRNQTRLIRAPNDSRGRVVVGGGQVELPLDEIPVHRWKATQVPKRSGALTIGSVRDDWHLRHHFEVGKEQYHRNSKHKTVRTVCYFYHLLFNSPLIILTGH